MPTEPVRSLAPSAVLLSGDRAAVRRFALRRAAISAMATVALVLTLRTGLMGSVMFGLFSGAVTYIGFATRGTRGLSITDQDARSGT
jgi:hypothetical protein